MSEQLTQPLCKGCKNPTHPAYISRYGGFCLDCENAGVPDLMEQIEGLQGELKQAAEQARLRDREITLKQEQVNRLAAERNEFEGMWKERFVQTRRKNVEIVAARESRKRLVGAVRQLRHELELDEVQLVTGVEVFEEQQAALTTAVATEKERCAQIAQDYADVLVKDGFSECKFVCREIAAAIRAHS